MKPEFWVKILSPGSSKSRNPKRQDVQVIMKHEGGRKEGNVVKGDSNIIGHFLQYILRLTAQETGHCVVKPIHNMPGPTQKCNDIKGRSKQSTF